MDIPSIVCHARWWLLLVGEGQEIIKLTNTKENISKKSQKKKRGGPVGVVAKEKRKVRCNGFNIILESHMRNTYKES